MSGSYICTSCRRRWLLELKSRASSRHFNRPSFASFNRDRSQVEASSNKTKIRPQLRKPSLRQNPRDAIEEDFLERIFKGFDPRSRPGPYSGSQEKRDIAATRSLAKDKTLPSKTIKSFTKPSNLPSVSPSTQLEASELSPNNDDLVNTVNRNLDLRENTTAQDPVLNDILNPNKTVEESLAAFQTYIANHKGFDDSLLARTAYGKLLEKITEHWCRNPVAQSHLLPSDFLGLKASYAEPKHRLWHRTTWRVIRSAVEVFSHTGTEAERDYGNSLLDELVRLWDMHLYRYGACTVTNRGKEQRIWNIKSWDLLNRSEELLRMKRSRSQDLKGRLSIFFRGAELADLGDIDSLFLITYVILRHYRAQANESSPRLTHYSSLVKFFAQLLPHHNIRNTLNQHIENIAVHLNEPSHREFVTFRILEAVDDSVGAAIGRNPNGFRSVNPPSESDVVETVLARIARTVSRKDLQRLQTLWDESKAYFASNKDSDSSKPSIPRRIYAHFMGAFMTLDRPSLAIDVWNAMVRDAIEPGAAEWDVMLKGTLHAKDPHALEQIWKGMVASGIKPDARLWTTRIHGLIRSGNWLSSMHRFEEMIQNWTSSALKSDEYKRSGDLTSIGDFGDTPKPNIYTLNTLVQGLSVGRKLDFVAKVLQQAAEIGIYPDRYTYNSIIRFAIMDKDFELADKLIAQMRDDNIKPDAALFTMVLRSVFSDGFQNSADTQNPLETQQSAVKEIFRQMRDSGIEPDKVSFSIIISGILEQSESHPGRMSSAQALSAAHAVLQQMQANNTFVPINIYTSLVSFHFSSARNSNSKPDFAAIDALWSQARGSFHKGNFVADGSTSVKSKANLDSFFYDRLIEGFAGAGEIGRMMTALAQAGKFRKTPSWLAMTEVVKALTAAGEWDRAKEVVAFIRAEEALVAAGDLSRPKTGKHYFWQVVEAAGLGPESVPPSSPASKDEQLVSGEAR